MKRVSVLVAIAVLGWGVTGQAGPLEFKDVPADAKAVVHVDVDAAHSSKVVHSFAEQVEKDWPHVKEKLAKFRERIGLAHWKDLHGVTVYTTKLAPRNGVLLAQGDWNAKTLLEKVEKARHHKSVDYGKYKIYTWVERPHRKGHGEWGRHEEDRGRHWWHHHWGRHKGHGQTVAGVLAKPDLLILAPNVELVKAALEVLDGKTPSLAGSSSPLAAKVPTGAIIVVRAMDLKDSMAAKWHPALDLIKSFSYVKGEHDGKWFADVSVTADSSATAENVGKIFVGYKAWLTLHAHKAPWFLDLLNKAKLDVEGNMVKVSFNEPVDEITAVMPKFWATFREHLKLFAAMKHGQWQHGKGGLHPMYKHGESAKKPAKTESMTHPSKMSEGKPAKSEGSNK